MDTTSIVSPGQKIPEVTARANRKYAKKIERMTSDWRSMISMEAANGCNISEDSKVVAEDLSAAAVKIANFPFDVKHFNQRALQFFFEENSVYRSHAAWVVYELIHNGGPYYLLKEEIAPNGYMLCSEYYLVPHWKNEVGDKGAMEMGPSEEDFDRKNVNIYNFQVAKYIEEVAKDSKRQYLSIVQKYKDYVDVSHKYYETLFQAAKSVSAFWCKVNLLTEEGLHANLKGVGLVTARRIILLIEKNGRFEKCKVTLYPEDKKFVVKTFAVKK
jgi:hypothetical protein